MSNESPNVNNGEDEITKSNPKPHNSPIINFDDPVIKAELIKRRKALREKIKARKEEASDMDITQEMSPSEIEKIKAAAIEAQRIKEEQDRLLGPSFEAPEKKSFSFAEAILATDKGPRAENQDGVFVSENGNFVVADGMGGMRNGRLATLKLLEVFKQGLDTEKTFEDLQIASFWKMMQENIGDGGACYLAGRFTEKDGKRFLNIAFAGDVILVVADKETGENKFVIDLGDDRLDKFTVLNSVQGSSPGVTHTKEIEVTPGDRIIVASDGLGDNLGHDLETDLDSSMRNFTKSIAGMSLDDAQRELYSSALEVMKEEGRGKKDNITILIIDIN
ncbi:MAG: hypothetical protein COU06_02085 [Candidatus Harrisonbacteria bacterium CG10_big_fil_rev_8_21_14_0_10_38_8]|uniref:PPM-type phosphatase domain-containing protein n=1 Tax=Candidatus Harrisonbacteria bacterium CG10_big_fil_rev_8_21_14_0_10_38_8 TaxID=1974582 RepID=A0A2M6WJR4_9BACT|nr:MAG: hypothetical protein COU06_02085 [Candidatus Harrisonbacteria bacterium CG10_big_fil_rev_8_21_14_0_10_38_8]